MAERKILLFLFGLTMHSIKCESTPSQLITFDSNDGTSDVAQMDAIAGNNTRSLSSIDQNVNLQTYQNGNQQFVESTDIDAYLLAFLAANNNAKLIRSSLEQDNMNQTFEIPFEAVQSVEIVIHLLNINPYTNYLLIESSSTDKMPAQIFNSSEPITPANIRRLYANDTNHLAIFFQFASSEWRLYRGFALTYQPLVNQVQNHSTNRSGDSITKTAADYKQPTLNIRVEVNETCQTNETWTLFERLLSESAHKYFGSSNDNVACSVHIGNTIDCSRSWSTARNCIRFEFAIKYNHTDLNAEQLLGIWLRHGRLAFTENGFREFAEKTPAKLFFFWAIVCLSIVMSFLMILAGIWKLDAFRDYRRMHWQNGAKEKRVRKSLQTDAATYPAIHQIVPTLFPNDSSATTDASNALPFEMVKKPITFEAGDFKRRASLEESLQPNKPRIAGNVPF